MDVTSTQDMQTDRAFFARLGLAFAVSILVSGIMMIAVGPVPQTAPQAAGEGTIIALNVQDGISMDR